MIRVLAAQACIIMTLSGPTVLGEIATIERPPAAGTNQHYVSSRDPLLPVPLIKLPIRAIEPRGWLRKQLQLEAEGFTGRLGEISRFLRKEGNAWLEPQAGEHGWEEVPYWLKGYQNVAFLLRDDKMIEEARLWIEAALRSQTPDGWFGPVSNRTRIDGKPDLWPNMIMLFCLQDYYDFSEDKRVLELMTRYFKYLTTIPEAEFLPDYWDTMRGGDLLSSVYWLYNLRGEPWLLDLAQKVHRKTAPWYAWYDQTLAWEKPKWHNVNFAQGFGEPATYWLQSRDPAHREAAYKNYDTMRELFGQFPGALYAGDENSRPGCDDPRQGIETCGIIEFMLSAERLATITGDVLWADRCEDAAFNTLPAALTADMKALRYLTAANLAVSDAKNHAPGFQNDGPMLHMNPHLHRCCQHNWAHGWPYFAEHLYFATADSGLAVVFYSESQVTAKVGSGTEIRLEQRTHYPFAESTRLIVHTSQPASFPLYLRVPRWCEKPAVQVNGNDEPIRGGRQDYLVLDRSWKDGDVVQLTLPMQIRLRHWPQNHHSVSVDRGPLTYSLEIGERQVQSGGTPEWPAWEILPTTPWNYGLVLPDGGSGSMEIVTRDWPGTDMPFTQEGVPLEIKAQGRRIPAWKLDRHGLVAELQDSPVKSLEPVEAITLIPMGAARLRIASFPVIGEGPDAREWTE